MWRDIYSKFAHDIKWILKRHDYNWKLDSIVTRIEKIMNTVIISCNNKRQI